MTINFYLSIVVPKFLFGCWLIPVQIKKEQKELNVCVINFHGTPQNNKNAIGKQFNVLCFLTTIQPNIQTTRTKKTRCPYNP